MSIKEILNNGDFTKEALVQLLAAEDQDMTAIFERSAAIKLKYLGNKVYFRGLIELCNICEKDCFYCGIRKSNPHFERYNLNDDEVMQAAQFAFDENYGSIVLQSGELQSEGFTARIERLLKKIKEMSGGKLGITLSLGEQSEETYRRWFEAGAHRYLLRIESSNKELYYKLHPKDSKHDYQARLDCLHSLRKVGFQVGTGVMIGLPFQTLEHLAEDLLFMKTFDIDMCGMGPYVEHQHTPLYEFHEGLPTQRQRFTLALKMIALLRLMMPKVNIAAATALQAIDPIGREKALRIGANIIMPNVTPGLYRDDYNLYENKPCTDEEASDCKNCLEARISISGNEIAYGEWGDSLQFKARGGQ